MKRLSLFLISILIIYVIYYDLTNGTLPADKEPAIEVMTKSETTLPFFEKKVSSGDTVLSIIERNIKGPLSVSISEVIIDFKSLNDGLKPEEIKSGIIYKFPDYNSNAQAP
ncbi:hypothetical protein F7731_02955 [Cytobacillus depressus]|uniref:LysM domain-containing protein n=1 Tax=Cytobacillus depressus TaxID=1602942 RepID=A0A6L3VCZ1_9BACI|nr:hypothetical protein [Cytobacillus depressus]KAB2338533.1 hypothetical protein F7731_02955 [Cytobacillus depressus]